MSRLILPESLSAKPTSEWEPTDVHSFLKENQSHFKLADETVSTLDQLTGEELVDIDQHNISAFNLDQVETYRVLRLLKHLKAPTDIERLKKSSSRLEDLNTSELRFRKAQEIDVKAANSSSSCAEMPSFRTQQKRCPVLNGRPYPNSGPPIGLFHPVFDYFQAEIEKHNPDPEVYQQVRELIVASAEIFKTEKDREEAIDPLLHKLLGQSFAIVHAEGVECDGVITWNSGSGNAYLVLREIKNEMGTVHTDPYNQGCLSYRKYWEAKSHEIFRKQCCCPSFLLAIAGPWLCVFGGIYVEQAILQPLTDYIWLGGPLQNNRLLSISRLFGALKLAISILGQYYQSISVFAPDGFAPDGFPFIREYPSRNQLQRFTYDQKLPQSDSHKQMYIATVADHHRLVVKFVSRYNALAHRLLAGHGLAPQIYYASTEDTAAPTYGGLYMVVMEFFDGESPTGTLPDGLYRRVVDALELLHLHDLVFGDLRAPNILIKGETAVLIDFDWCGKAGEGRYPEGINLEIDWPQGVGPRKVMAKEHDLCMLEKLKDSSNTRMEF